MTERERLHRSVRKAFGLAKAGEVGRGYRQLHRDRERAAALAVDDPEAADLLRWWDAAVRWFEQYAASPL